jgi:hypothetical protein
MSASTPALLPLRMVSQVQCKEGFEDMVPEAGTLSTCWPSTAAL